MRELMEELGVGPNQVGGRLHPTHRVLSGKNSTRDELISIISKSGGLKDKIILSTGFYKFISLVIETYNNHVRVKTQVLLKILSPNTHLLYHLEKCLEEQ